MKHSVFWMGRGKCLINNKMLSYLSEIIISLRFEIKNVTKSTGNNIWRWGWPQYFILIEIYEPWIVMFVCVCVCVCVRSLQSCPTLCDCMDCSPPGSSVHGILQARTGMGCHAHVKSWIILELKYLKKIWSLKVICES